MAHVKVVAGLLILNSDLKIREGKVGMSGDDWMVHAEIGTGVPPSLHPDDGSVLLEAPWRWHGRRSTSREYEVERRRDQTR